MPCKTKPTAQGRSEATVRLKLTLCGCRMTVTTTLCQAVLYMDPWACALTHYSPQMKTGGRSHLPLSPNQAKSSKPPYKTRSDAFLNQWGGNINFLLSFNMKTSKYHRRAAQNRARLCKRQAWSHKPFRQQREKRETLQAESSYRLPWAWTAAPSSTYPRLLSLFACPIIWNRHTIQFTGKQEASCLHYYEKYTPLSAMSAAVLLWIWFTCQGWWRQTSLGIRSQDKNLL